MDNSLNTGYVLSGYEEAIYVNIFASYMYNQAGSVKHGIVVFNNYEMSEILVSDSDTITTPVSESRNTILH